MPLPADAVDAAKAAAPVHPCAICAAESNFAWWGHWLCPEHGAAWHDAELDLPTTKTAAEVQRATDAWVKARAARRAA